MKKIIDMVSMHFNYEVIAILTTIDIIGKNMQVEIKKTKGYTDVAVTRTRLPLYSRSPCNH